MWIYFFKIKKQTNFKRMKNSSRKISYLFAIALICLIGFGINSDAQAQGKRGMKKGNMSPTEMAAKKTAKMTKYLGLDSDQAAKVKVINEKYITEMAEVRKMEGDREAKWAKIKGLMDAQSAELKTVLTTEQYAKIESKMADKKQKRQDRMDKAMEKAGTPAERAEKRTAKMTKHLDLNSEQAAKVKAINLKYAQKREELRGAKGEKSDRFEQMKSMKDAQKAEMKAVLTTEQFTKLEEKMRVQERKGQATKRYG